MWVCVGGVCACGWVGRWGGCVCAVGGGISSAESMPVCAYVCVCARACECVYVCEAGLYHLSKPKHPSRQSTHRNTQTHTQPITLTHTHHTHCAVCDCLQSTSGCCYGHDGFCEGKTTNTPAHQTPIQTHTHTRNGTHVHPTTDSFTHSHTHPLTHSHTRTLAHSHSYRRERGSVLVAN